MAAELEKEIKTDKITNNSNLPDVVASMEMLTVDSETSSNSNNSNSSHQTRYQMRRRIPKISKAAQSEGLNRRCSLKPKKRSYSTLDNDGEIQEYYLNRKIKKKPNTKLETIYEELNGITENSNVISAKSFKRLIQFNCDKRTVAAKIKKRKAKIERVFGSKIKLKSSNVTMQALVKKLNGIRSEMRTAHDD